MIERFLKTDEKWKRKIIHNYTRKSFGVFFRSLLAVLSGPTMSPINLQVFFFFVRLAHN